MQLFTLHEAFEILQKDFPIDWVGLCKFISIGILSIVGLFIFCWLIDFFIKD